MSVVETCSMVAQIASPATAVERIFPGQSDLSRRLRALDWSATGLGNPRHWSENLLAAIRLCLTSSFPAQVWCGPQHLVIYNDACLPFLGERKRARSLLLPVREAWTDIWDTVGPMLDCVTATGEGVGSERLDLFFDRTVRKEEVVVSLNLSPIFGADGAVEGIFCQFHEYTEQVIAARRLQTLRAVGARSRRRTVKSVCEQGVAALRENPRDIAFAAVYVTQRGEARLTASFLPPGDHLLPAKVDVENDAHSAWPLTQVLRSKESADCVDLEARGIAIPGGQWHELTRQGLVMPLQAMQEQPAGILVVGINPRRPLDADYRAFLAAVTEEIASGIADAQLYEVERRELETMNRLRDLAVEFLHNTDVSALLHKVLDASIDLLGADAGTVQLYDSVSKTLRIVAQRGFRRDFLDYFDTVHEGMGACGAALSSRKRVMVEDVLLEPIFASHLPIMASANCRAVQSTPVISRTGELLGTLSTHFRRPHRPAERELQLLDLYARQTADLLERRRAEESLQRAHSELAHVARAATMGEMATTVAHEVNQPLAAIVANARACARWLAMEPSNRQEADAAIARIVRDATRASDTIARIRTFVQRRPLQCTALDLAEVVREAARMTEAEIKRQGAELILTPSADLPPALGDCVQLQQVILNLLKNAVEAMETVTDRRRTLDVAVDRHDAEALHVSVRDAGIGLADVDREKIFDAFHTTKADGMGMGLAISRSIVEAHGGKLWVTPNERHGETFHFTVPLAR